MYDKLGLMLRVETVINQPGEFKLLRECRHRDGSKSMGWFAMCKGVGNMHHYQRHAWTCNQRYLDALAAVEDPAPVYDDLKQLTERQRNRGRSYAGFNPVLGKKKYACSPPCWPVTMSRKDSATRTSARLCTPNIPEPRNTFATGAAVGRLLKRLHIRGLIAKVPHTSMMACH